MQRCISPYRNVDIELKMYQTPRNILGMKVRDRNMSELGQDLNWDAIEENVTGALETQIIVHFKIVIRHQIAYLALTELLALL